VTKAAGVRPQVHAGGLAETMLGKPVPAPTNVIANAADDAASVAWSVSKAIAGSHLIGYVVTSLPACKHCTGLQTKKTGVVVRGLTNNRTYHFTVKAIVAGINSAPSRPSNAVIPRLEQPTINLVEPKGNLVSSFALGARSNAAPLSNISGHETKLNRPEAITFDAFGRLYTANYDVNRITEYPVRVGPSARPTNVLQGAAAKLSHPAAVTVGPDNRLCVANQGTNGISVYRYGAKGNSAPVKLLGGSQTKLSSPSGVTVGPDGTLYVTNGNDSITEYSAHATGNAKPIRVIEGAKTLLKSPHALLIDGANRLVVTNPGSNSIIAFASGAKGNAAPVATIRGPRTGLSGAFGLDVDTQGNLYASNFSSGTVTEYSPTAQGDVSPIATIGGSLTGLKNPSGIGLSPPFAVISSPILPTSGHGRSYSAKLQTDLGTTPYAWNIVSGSLPHGLHLLRSGVIVGSTSQAGKFDFTVKVTDSSSHPQVATQKMSLKVS